MMETKLKADIGLTIHHFRNINMVTQGYYYIELRLFTEKKKKSKYGLYSFSHQLFTTNHYNNDDYFL